MSHNSVVVPILTYHQVTDSEKAIRSHPGLVVTTKSFRRQLMILRALGYTTIRAHELAAILLAKFDKPRRLIIITFDDGYAGVYEHAYKLLQKHGYRGTLFLIAEDFGGRSDLSSRAFPILDSIQVLEMIGNGFEIGSHSISHPDLSELETPQIQNEILNSKIILEDTFGQPVTCFSYPYGSYTHPMLGIVRAAEYSTAVSTHFGRSHSPEEILRLKRIPVGGAQSLPHFVYRLLWHKEETR